MSIAPFLTLVSEVLPVNRRDFYVADPTLLNPLVANPLIDGEWLQLDANYKLARGSGEQAIPAYQLFAERGRYDTQAIGKAPVLFMGPYEAQTSVYDPTGLAVGDALVVQMVTVGGIANRRGLAKLGVGAGAHMIFGYVSRVLTGKIQYVAYPPHWKTV